VHLVAKLAVVVSLVVPPAAPSPPIEPRHEDARGPGADTLTADLELVRRAQAARALGASPDSAEVTILEFFDYACSTCQDFHRERGDSLKALAGPEVSLAFHHYIIPRLLRGYPAAEAAACAAGLGGTEAFLSYHDRLLHRPDAWRDGSADPDRFRALAADLGLDEAAFADCIARDVPSMLIVADGQLAARFDVGGTPTFVILPRGADSVDDAVVFYGNEPMARFHDAIAEARTRARAPGVDPLR
jgi:protein-disulfide isomerase